MWKSFAASAVAVFSSGASTVASAIRLLEKSTFHRAITSPVCLASLWATRLLFQFGRKSTRLPAHFMAPSFRSSSCVRAQDIRGFLRGGELAPKAVVVAIALGQSRHNPFLVSRAIRAISISSMWLALHSFGSISVSSALLDRSDAPRARARCLASLAGRVGAWVHSISSSARS